MGVRHGNDTTDQSSTDCKLHTSQESMNTSSKLKTLDSAYIVVDFVFNDILNTKIKKNAYKSYQQWKGQQYLWSMSAHKTASSSTKGGPWQIRFDIPNYFVKTWKRVLQALSVPAPTNAEQTSGYLTTGRQKKKG